MENKKNIIILKQLLTSQCIFMYRCIFNKLKYMVGFVYNEHLRINFETVVQLASHMFISMYL